MDGVVRAPSEFSMTLGWPFSITATQELVVPRSMPIIFAMFYLVGFSADSINDAYGGRAPFFNALCPLRRSPGPDGSPARAAGSPSAGPAPRYWARRQHPRC